MNSQGFRTLRSVTYELGKLLPDARLIPDSPASAQTPVSGLAQSSWQIREGDLFVALDGAEYHGARFGGEAKKAGARAMLSDAKGAALAAGCGLVVAECAKPRRVMVELAEKFYPFSQTGMRLYAVTGTNGKTSTVHIAAAILQLMHKTTGISTTVERRIAGRFLTSALTTPEVCELYAHLAAAAEAGVEYFGLEASSHAINRGRLGRIRVDVAGFTNLTPEHLEEHAEMEDYFQAKARLFAPKHCARAVVNTDTPWGFRLALESKVPTERVSHVFRPDSWLLETRLLGIRQSWLRLTSPRGQSLECVVRLTGQVFADNTGLAIVMLTQLGFSLEEMARVLTQPGGLWVSLPARMEVFRVGLSPKVVVDHGHTTDAVLKSVTSARSLTDGRLITLINADGGRDRSKRARLGQICAEHSDVLVVTDGHSRYEDPAEIRGMIIAGALVRECEVIEQPEMPRAVRLAIGLARPEDTVLCAGFGDDPYFDVLGVKHPYDLRQDVNDALVEAGYGQEGYFS